MRRVKSRVVIKIDFKNQDIFEPESTIIRALAPDISIWKELKIFGEGVNLIYSRKNIGRIEIEAI